MQHSEIPSPPIASLGHAIGLAVTSGLLYTLALPPVGWSFLGWIALTPACLAVARRGARLGVGLGLLVGLTAACASSPWLPAMIADYFEAGFVWAWPLAMIGWMLGGALYFGVFGGWLGWATARRPVSPWVVGAAFWLLEWARANAPVPNPWALIGYSQIGWLPAAQVVDWLGPFGLGALLAATSAAAAELVVGRWEAWVRRRDVVSLIVVIAFVHAYGFMRLAEPPSEGDPSIRIGLVQGAVPTPHRYGAEHLDRSLETHLDLTRQAVERGAELVLWPELAMDFYLEREPERHDEIVSALRALQVDLLAGGLGVEVVGRSIGPTNSVFLVTADGIAAQYAKVRLMVFSETRAFPWLPLGSDRLVAGEAPLPIRRENVEYGIAICSEMMHPDFVRETVRAGAEVIVAPTIDSWFGSPSGLRQQLGAVAMRAIETRRWVIRPTASGLTTVIDPHGRVVAEAPVDEPAVVVADFTPKNMTTPYVRFGDAPVGVALLLVAFDTRRRLGADRRDDSA